MRVLLAFLLVLLVSSTHVAAQNTSIDGRWVALTMLPFVSEGDTAIVPTAQILMLRQKANRIHGIEYRLSEIPANAWGQERAAGQFAIQDIVTGGIVSEEPLTINLVMKREGSSAISFTGRLNSTGSMLALESDVDVGLPRANYRRLPE